MRSPPAWLWWLVSGLLACSTVPGASRGASQATVEVCPEGQASTPSGGCQAAAAPAPSQAPAALASAPRPSMPVFRPMPGGNVGSLQGSWLGEDSDGSASYDLQVTANGHFLQIITTLNGSSGRPPGSCEQEGHLRVEAEQVVWFYERNSCNTDYENREDPDNLVESSPRHFVIQMSSYQIHYNRR